MRSVTLTTLKKRVADVYWGGEKYVRLSDGPLGISWLPYDQA